MTPCEFAVVPWGVSVYGLGTSGLADRKKIKLGAF